MGFERLYLAALRADDPVRAMQRLARDPKLDLKLRRRLAAADPNGVRLTALLVAKLRFERLLNGSAAAAGWFKTDPSNFTQAFRRYHREVPQTAFFPKAEARAFEVWRTQTTL